MEEIERALGLTRSPFCISRARRNHGDPSAGGAYRSVPVNGDVKSSGLARDDPPHRPVLGREESGLNFFYLSFRTSEKSPATQTRRLRSVPKENLPRFSVKNNKMWIEEDYGAECRRLEVLADPLPRGEVEGGPKGGTARTWHAECKSTRWDKAQGLSQTDTGERAPGPPEQTTARSMT